LTGIDISFKYGSWGVCYTYGTWFGIKGLVDGGRTYQNSNSIRKACDFLLSKQLDSGGWAESYLSCQDKAKRDPTTLDRATKVLINSQMKNGDFPQQSKYTQELLQRFGLENAKPRGTPISPSVNLIKDENGKDVDSKLFRGKTAKYKLTLGNYTPYV
ncbi:hypothetical protein RJ640_019251, partial [Escallonia rubra]